MNATMMALAFGSVLLGITAVLLTAGAE